MAQIRKILTPVDFSDHSEAALSYALSLAKDLDATVSVIHVYEVPFYLESAVLVVPTVAGQALPVKDAIQLEARERFQKYLERASSKGLVPDAIDLVEGVPFRAIVSYAKEHEFDLIVMGTRGRSGAARMLLGSVAARVIEHADCPVLTVRGAG
jgi:nucleotide-binding universal stress UspA family protein